MPLFFRPQTVTGDTIVSSKASAAAATQRAQCSEKNRTGSLVLAGVEVPEPVFFCSIEPPSMAKQAGTLCLLCFKECSYILQSVCCVDVYNIYCSSL